MDDADLPVYLATHEFMSGRLDESPWSPELLEERILMAEEAKPAMPMRHALALLTPTELMPVVVPVAAVE